MNLKLGWLAGAAAGALLATGCPMIYPAQHVSALDLFSIITPSFRPRKWLPLCVASVADQKGVRVEHIVQDAGSDDGAVEWLQAKPDVRSSVERDNGMGDAINQGLRRVQGEILAHLNADEAKPTCAWWNRAPRRAGGYYRRLKLKMGGLRRKPSEVELLDDNGDDHLPILIPNPGPMIHRSKSGCQRIA